MKIYLLLALLSFNNLLLSQINKQAAWQQHVAYTIAVSLDDENHILNGNIEMDYTNNSPNTLTEIWIHLWPNAYKNNNTAFAKQQIVNNTTAFYFAKERNRGFIDSLNFRVGNDTLKLTYDPDHIDIAKLTLKTPLNTGETLTISSPFRVKVPGSFSRMGHVKNSYQITQWFPKPAVYDVNGWNPMPYLDQGEFYSEFGSFDVSITVPQNYAVAATGVLQDSLEKAWIQDRITYFKGRSGRDEEEVASSALLKTLHFKQDSVHDFAWFADKEFYIFESEQMLADSSATIKTYLYSRSEYDKNSIKYVNQGIEFYSKKVGNYPYKYATAVIGPLKAGGGMEYPMITVLASSDKTTVVHEVGHNWFYGILGTNERAFPWMDESINTYYENRHSKSTQSSGFKKSYTSKTGAQSRFSDGLSIVYANSLTRNTDQAVDLNSVDYTSSNYGGIIYGKGAYIFSLLQQYLGDSMFDAAMQNYYNQWKFKHPLPEDFKESIQTFTGQDLNWFFIDLLTTTKNYDYKISRIKYKKLSDEDLANDGENYKVLVKNTGDIAAPFQIMTLDKDGEKLVSRWDTGFLGSKWITIPGTERLRSLDDESLKTKEASRVNRRMDKVTQVAINLDNPLNEDNIHNNRIKTTGLFKKTEPLAIGGANHLDRRTTPSITPLVNYNYYDNWMLGAGISNLAHWERRFHYYALGMYSNSLAPIKYELFARQMFPINSSFANRLDIYGKTSSFGHEPGLSGLRSTYQRHNTGVSVYFRNAQKPNDRTFKKLDVNYNMLSDVRKKDKTEGSLIAQYAYSNIITAKYEYKSNSKLNPFEYAITAEQISVPTTITFSTAHSFQKIFAEATKVFDFRKSNNYLKVRGFAGFIFSGKPTPSTYLYSAAGNNGLTDYKYNNNLLARSEGFRAIPQGVLGARVLLPHFSGMRAPALLLSNGAIQAINLEYNLKKSFPFNLYFDASYMSNPVFGENFNYVGGINFILIKNYVEISLPLIYSADIAANMDLNGLKQSKANSVNYNPFKDWHRLIVFKLNLNLNQDDLINLSGL